MEQTLEDWYKDCEFYKSDTEETLREEAEKLFVRGFHEFEIIDIFQNITAAMRNEYGE